MEHISMQIVRRMGRLMVTVGAFLAVGSIGAVAAGILMDREADRQERIKAADDAPARSSEHVR